MISVNDPTLAEQIKRGLATDGFVILKDLALPIETDLDSYVEKAFSKDTRPFGTGKMCFFYKGTAVDPVYSYLEDVVKNVLGALDSKYAKEIEGSTHSCVQLTRYPKIATNGSTALNEHTDPSLVTILMSGSRKGLFLQGHVTGWQEIQLDQGCAVVFAGTGLEKMSGGEYKGVVHKVANTFDQKVRYACQFFPFPASGFNVPFVDMSQESYAYYGGPL